MSAIMSRPKEPSPFFALPLELREEVYKDVLASPNQGQNILRTCREMHLEARKCLYQTPLSFRSQYKLYTWLDQAPHELLVCVSEIAIHIQDVDLKPILDARTLGPLKQSRTHLLTPEIYHAEVQNLGRSLKKIPNLKAITIRSLRTPSFLYHDFMAQFLNLLIATCPSLMGIRLDGEFHHQELHFLSGLKRLESFCFDGFSSSSPAATAQILAKLEQLRTLALVSNRLPIAPTVDLHHESMPKIKSFTSEVARAMRQLASFSVFESAPASSRNLFFTPEVLSSLQEHKALKHLSVNLSHTPDTATLSSLEEFLDKTYIERLELDWPDLDPSILERYNLLSGHLKVLWVRAKSEGNTLDLLRLIVKRHKNRQMDELKKVVLVRSSKYGERVLEGTCNRKDSATDAKKVGLNFFSLSHAFNSKLFSNGKGCHTPFMQIY
jgi:hypothetical protein